MDTSILHLLSVNPSFRISTIDDLLASAQKMCVVAELPVDLFWDDLVVQVKRHTSFESAASEAWRQLSWHYLGFKQSMDHQNHVYARAMNNDPIINIHARHWLKTGSLAWSRVWELNTTHLWFDNQSHQWSFLGKDLLSIQPPFQHPDTWTSARLQHLHGHLWHMGGTNSLDALQHRKHIGGLMRRYLDWYIPHENASVHIERLQYALLNIWMSQDISLLDTWKLIAGEHADAIQAKTFYNWILTMADGHLNMGNQVIDKNPILHMLFTKPLPEPILDSLHGCLNGHCIDGAIDLEKYAMGLSGWNLYLENLGYFYNDANPFFEFQQWHALTTHHAPDVSGEPWLRLHHSTKNHTRALSYWYNLQNPNMFSPSERKPVDQVLSMYKYILVNYVGDDLHRMEATMALTGFPPAKDHPRFRDLIELFYYCVDVLPNEHGWDSSIDSPKADEEHPLHALVQTHHLLHTKMEFQDYLNIYMCIQNDQSISPLELSDSSSLLTTNHQTS